MVDGLRFLVFIGWIAFGGEVGQRLVGLGVELRTFISLRFIRLVVASFMQGEMFTLWEKVILFSINTLVTRTCFTRWLLQRWIVGVFFFPTTAKILGINRWARSWRLQSCIGILTRSSSLSQGYGCSHPWNWPKIMSESQRLWHYVGL